MRTTLWRAARALALLGLAALACRSNGKTSASSTSASSSSSSSSSAEAPAPSAGAEVAGVEPRRHPPLPENAELGRRSTAQWEEHEREEEQNRRHCYDHEREPQHLAVSAALERLRQRYERARTASDVAAAQALARSEAPALRQQLDAIDPWQNSSLLIADYAATIALLEQPPAAARSGSAAGLDQLRSELGQRLRALEQKLEASEECEEEE